MSSANKWALGVETTQARAMTKQKGTEYGCKTIFFIEETCTGPTWHGKLAKMAKRTVFSLSCGKLRAFVNLVNEGWPYVTFDKKLISCSFICLGVVGCT